MTGLAAQRWAFRLGWAEGQERGEDLTQMEAEPILYLKLRRPPTSIEVDSFCQGSVDGALGDSWRLRLQARVPPCS